MLKGVPHDHPQTPHNDLPRPHGGAFGAVWHESAVGQRFADPAGRAGGPAGQRAGRALYGHHPAAAAPPGGHGDPAGGGALGSRLSAPDLFCQPHCGPVCHGHFQRCQAGRGLHHGDVPQSGALHQLGGAHHRRLCGCHGGDGLCAGCGPAGAADEHSGHLRRHDRLYLLCHHGHRGYFCAGLQHRQPPQLVHGQLFGRYLGQCAGGGLCGAARAGSLVLPLQAHGGLPAGGKLRQKRGRGGAAVQHGAGASFQPAGGLRHGLCRADLLCGHCGAPPCQGGTGQR